MKNLINILAFALAVCGLVLKARYLAGANICIVLSCATLLLSLFVFAFKDNKEAGSGDGPNYLLVGVLAFYIVGLVFKYQHWTGSGILVVTAYALAFAFPILLMLQKDNFKVSKQYTITFFTYFILVIGLFPNNPIHKYLGTGQGNNLTRVETDSTVVITKDVNP